MNWIKKNNKEYTFILIIISQLLFYSTASHASITFEFPTDITGYAVVPDSFPQLTCPMKIYQDGNLIKITADNLLIIEDNIASKPFDILDSNDWQNVKWHSNIKGLPYPIYKDSLQMDTIKFLVTYNNNVGIDSARFSIVSIPIIQLYNYTNKYQKDYEFGDVAVGTNNQTLINLKPISAFMKKEDNGYVELPLRVDSVKTHSQEFSYKWIGNSLNTQLPPVDVYSGFNYQIDAKFAPLDNNYHRDKLTVYYEGGATTEVNLIGNHFDLPISTTLKVIQPNGSEIITPCEEYLIKWTGYSPEFPTKIDYSIDNGLNWTNIDYVYGSTYIWEVPKIISTDEARIRVYQNFALPRSTSLINNQLPIYSVNFNDSANSFLSADISGIVYEWNSSTLEHSQEYYTGNFNSTYKSIVPRGITYLSDTNQFALAFSRAAYDADLSRDTIAFFKRGTYDAPYLKVGTDSIFHLKKMYLSPDKKIFALEPILDNKLIFLSATDASLIKKLTFTAPVSTYAFNPSTNEFLVALYNGYIERYSLSDFSLIKRYDFTDFPIISCIDMSPDGKYLAIGTKTSTATPITNAESEIDIYDINTEMIVKTLPVSINSPISLKFNKLSSSLIVGSKIYPQVVLWKNFNSTINYGGSSYIFTDVDFSYNGHYIIYSSATTENLVFNAVSFDELDISDNAFSINTPSPNIDTILFSPRYLGWGDTLDITSSFCNNESIPYYVNYAYLEKGTNFSIISFPSGDTLLPDSCLKFSINFTPKDTGTIYDNLIISTCSKDFVVPIKATGLNRNIYLYKKDIDFGEYCINNSIDKEFIFARNDDPVPLLINYISITEPYDNSPFWIITPYLDSIIQPGESINVGIRFTPKQLGENYAKAGIFHSNQTKIASFISLQGLGIGTLLYPNHYDLRFIPEIPNRDLVISNTSTNDISIDSVDITPSGIFTLSTQLPITINAKSSNTITVHWNGNDDSLATFKFYASPCAVTLYINAGPYIASSTLSIPTIEADPRGNTSIPVYYNNVENASYDGSRPFKGAITINQGMFLPTDCKSDYGDCNILSNTVNGSTRQIAFEVNGNFPLNGTIAVINGIAGLAESDSSIISFNQSYLYWSSAVQNHFSDGTLKLINLCGNTRIEHPTNALYLNSLSPNPALNYLTVKFQLDTSASVFIEIYNEMGIKVYSSKSFDAITGINNYDINLNSFTTGTYKIVIWKDAKFVTGSFVIVK